MSRRHSGKVGAWMSCPEPAGLAASQAERGAGYDRLVDAVGPAMAVPGRDSTSGRLRDQLRVVPRGTQVPTRHGVGLLTRRPPRVARTNMGFPGGPGPLRFGFLGVTSPGGPGLPHPVWGRPARLGNVQVPGGGLDARSGPGIPWVPRRPGGARLGAPIRERPAAGSTWNGTSGGRLTPGSAPSPDGSCARHSRPGRPPALPGRCPTGAER